jgi:MFS family permease
LTVFFPTLAPGFLGLTIFFSQVTYFFQQIGFADPFKVTVIVNGLLMGGSLLASVMVDKIGRRYPYIISSFILWICCLIVGCLGLIPQTTAVNSALTAITCLWVIAFPYVAGIGYAWAGEVPSARLKARTYSLVQGVNSAIQIALGYMYPYMLNANQWNWGLKSGFYFFGLGAPTLVVTWFFSPETTG